MSTPWPATGRRARADELDRLLPARRRHHHDLGRRGALARPAAATSSALKAHGDRRPALFDNFRPSGVKVHAGAPIIEEGMVEERLQGAWPRPASSCWARSASAGSRRATTPGEMVGLGAQVRHPVHHPHRRAVDPRLRPDRQGRRARGRRRHHRPHQRRPHRAARRPDPAACASSASAASRSCTTATSGRRCWRCAPRASSARLERVILGTDAPGRLRRPAARHPAHDRDAVGARRGAGRDRVLLRDRQHRAHARSRLRADRGRARGRFRAHRPRPARAGQDHPRERSSWATCPASA